MVPDENSMEDPCATPPSGAWSAWTMSHPTQIGRARHPGPSSTSHHLGIEVLNVGGWLTHGDLALDTAVDFLAVVDQR